MISKKDYISREGKPGEIFAKATLKQWKSTTIQRANSVTICEVVALPDMQLNGLLLVEIRAQGRTSKRLQKPSTTKAKAPEALYYQEPNQLLPPNLA